jgi:hypothetical protein
MLWRRRFLPTTTGEVVYPLLRALLCLVGWYDIVYVYVAYGSFVEGTLGEVRFAGLESD